MHEISYRHRHELVEQNFAGCCRDCQQSLEIIKPRLMAFADRIRSASLEKFLQLPLAELYAQYQFLDDLAHLDVGDHLAGLILNEPDIRRNLPLIRSYYTAFFDIHEACLGEDILSAADPWKKLRSFPLYRRYEVLAASQAEAMPPPAGTRLAFVGCGPVPLTLILLAAGHGVRSVGLDSDPGTVALAGRVIRCLGLEEMIEVIHGTECALEQLEWSMVLTAALAEPKARIFRNLCGILARRGPAPVVFRTYSGMKAVLHEPVRPDDLQGFHVVRTIPPTGRVNNTTVLLRFSGSPDNSVSTPCTD